MAAPIPVDQVRVWIMRWNEALAGFSATMRTASDDFDIAVNLGQQKGAFEELAHCYIGLGEYPSAKTALGGLCKSVSGIYEAYGRNPEIGPGFLDASNWSALIYAEALRDPTTCSGLAKYEYGELGRVAGSLKSQCFISQLVLFCVRGKLAEAQTVLSGKVPKMRPDELEVVELCRSITKQDGNHFSELLRAYLSDWRKSAEEEVAPLSICCLAGMGWKCLYERTAKSTINVEIDGIDTGKWLNPS